LFIIRSLEEKTRLRDLRAQFLRGGFVMREKIVQLLGEIEQTEGIRILYACESGSRAWGFPSADSDYDVRFLYVHPLEWYLSIEDHRDVIEYPVQEQLDVAAGTCGKH
jgi:hypothetical protein